jgi:hypothetical protein
MIRTQVRKISVPHSNGAPKNLCFALAALNDLARRMPENASEGIGVSGLKDHQRLSFRSKLVHKAQILGTADALSSPEKTDAIILGSDQA